MKPQQLSTQIASLPDSSMAELVQLWNGIFDNPPRNRNKMFMIRKIAWRLQELAYGGLSDDTKVKISSLQRQPAKATKNKKYMPPVGTILERHYQGEDHRVLVLKDGFEYRHCKYKSLSEIATMITGTKWSGPRFFGLKAV